MKESEMEHTQSPIHTMTYNPIHRHIVRPILASLSEHATSHTHLSSSLLSSSSLYLPRTSLTSFMDKSIVGAMIKDRGDWVYRLEENKHLMVLMDVATEGVSHDDFFATHGQLKEDFLKAYANTKDWGQIMREFDHECEKYPGAFSRACNLHATEYDGKTITMSNVGSIQAVLGVVPSQEYISLFEKDSEPGKGDGINETFIPLSDIRSVVLNRPHTVKNDNEMELFSRDFEHTTGGRRLSESGVIRDGRIGNLSRATRAIGGYLLKGKDNTLTSNLTRAQADVVSAARELYRDGVPIITVEPEVTKISVHPNMRFIIVATDSFWKLLSPQAAVEYVYSQLYSPLSEMPTEAEVKFRMSDNSIVTNLVARALVEPLVQQGYDPMQALQHLFTSKDRSNIQSSDVAVSIAFLNPSLPKESDDADYILDEPLREMGKAPETIVQMDYLFEPIKVADYRRHRVMEQV